MMKKKEGHICKACGEKCYDKFCGNCGQTIAVSRLTVNSLLHEVFHYFTHLDKGFLYTLKSLVIRPGKMQQEYITGRRVNYQKPFSMFFICGSLTALALYMIHAPNHNASHFREVQSHFTRHYYVLLQSALLPFYAFITWIFFRNNKLNYAESLVLFAYSLSAMLLMVILTNLVDLIPDKNIPSGYYEIPPLFAYFFWTCLNFFKNEPKWRLFLKTLIIIVASYFIYQYSAGYIVNRLL